MRGAIRALSLLCAVVTASCECGREQTEEERLRARIDTTKVHLYAASRYALGGGDDPDAVRAREHIGSVIVYLREHRDGTPPVRDTIALGSDLWELREQGQRIVRSEDEEGQQPILPVLLTLGRAPAGSHGPFSDIDLDTEHAIFLIAFTAMKLDERVPVPVPIEVVLYEAWRTHPETLTIPWLEPGARMCKAWTYATNDFCDLASREADAIDARSTDEWAALFAEARAGMEDDPERRRRDVGALRAVVHGATGQCYMKRGDDDSAAPHLARFCDGAEEAGTPPEDLALLRAYLAYKDGDLAATREHLTTAKRSENLSDSEKREIDRIIAHLDREERGALDRYFDGAFIGTIVLRVAAARVAEAAEANGSRDDAQAMRDARGVIGALGSGIGSVQGAEQAAEGTARSLWDRVFGD